MFKPEILAPAGDLEKLKTAFLYGADACYMGVKAMSMRMKINDEDGNVLEEALRIKNELGKKLYLTMNVHAHEYKLSFLEKELDNLTKLHEKGLAPDAILVSDVGVLAIIQEKCPWIPIHISTQANILNSAGIAFWAKQGSERVVLGREASLREIKKIREELDKKGVKVEIEGFVHGAMCMAYSGRCLLSSFMTSRDANEGMCAHSCRWNYKLYKSETRNSKLENDGSQYYLEEELRPGEMIPIEEDDNGTYIMSSKDMCMVEHLKDLIDARVDSLKIEGRHKSIYYTAIVSRIYRQGLDLAMEGKSATPELLELVESINTRGYFTGFWYGKPGAEGQKYETRNDYNEHFCFAGAIRKIEGDEMILEVRNTLKKGDELDIITPTENIHLTLDDFVNAANDEKVEVAHPGQDFSIKLKAPDGAQEGFIIRKKLKPEDLVKNRKKVEVKIENCKKPACS